jgi:hypothetical protein
MTRSQNYFQKCFLLIGLALLAALAASTARADCTPPPSGIVAWWAAEGNANDSIYGNNGTWIGDASYATGEVGQCFSPNGTNSGISVAASATLNVGTQSGLTIEGWVNPANLNNLNEYLVGWRMGSDGYGVHIKLSQVLTGFSGPSAGTILVDLKDIYGTPII